MICGKELEMLGLVKGSTIQTVNAVREMMPELLQQNAWSGRLRQWGQMQS